ncbi:MAG: hypothetical protein JNG84_00505 [Archangium sp.]|nr:hypothetical protein [Archangium sp.]
MPAAKNDAASIRKKILADPNTEGIAKNLGVTLDEYVDRVVHFVLNPSDDPEIYLAEDEDLEAMGMKPPDEGSMLKYLKEAFEALQSTEKTDFSAAPKRTMSLDGAPAVKTADVKDKKLGDDLKKQLRGKRNKG